MAEPEKRLGWGEPITLGPDQADAARDLVARTFPMTGTNEYRQWSILRAVLIPPVLACKKNRDEIDQASGWVDGVDAVPDVSDPGYEEFQRVGSRVLQQAIDAYESRPAGCEMEMSGDDDNFDCDRCNFSRSTDIAF